MGEFSGPDRRVEANRYVSVVVDVALTCRETLGENAAKLLFLTHHVPSTVAARVLFHKAKRRATELENSTGPRRTHERI